MPETGRIRHSLAAGWATASDKLGRLAMLIVPARLRRIYVPPAYSAIDRAAGIIFGFTCGILQAIGRFPRAQDAYGYWIANLDHLYPAQWGVDGQYIYPPPLAQITTILHPIGWQILNMFWTNLPLT